jgi:hypothetical protein
MFLATLQPKTATLQKGKNGAHSTSSGLIKVKNGTGDRDRTGDLLFTKYKFFIRQ